MVFQVETSQWSDNTEEIHYRRSKLMKNNGYHYRSLEFTFNFTKPHMSIYLAYTYPYTLT